jgi:hypothetical protein
MSGNLAANPSLLRLNPVRVGFEHGRRFAQRSHSLEQLPLCDLSHIVLHNPAERRGRLADKHVAWANVVLFLHSYAPSDPHQQADELRRFISLPQLYQAGQTGVDSTIPQVLEINVIDVWKARTLWNDGCKEAEVEVLLR